MDAASNAWSATIASASPGAVDLALVIVAVAIAVTAVGGIWLVVRSKAQELLGPGATPKQVAGLLDDKINGALVRIESKQDKLEQLVASRHGENQERYGEIIGRLRALETLEFMASSYPPVIKRRRPPP